MWIYIFQIVCSLSYDYLAICIFFHQFSRLSTEHLKCLNRGDIGPKLFQKKIIQNFGKKRRNFNRLIKTNSTHVLCNKGQTVYELDDLCKRSIENGTNYKKPCLLDTGETIEL